nr:hypothetical protein [Tanacetum cinerariifolium]
MAPKRTSTSAAPSMNQVVIWELIDDRVVAALEAQVVKDKQEKDKIGSKSNKNKKRGEAGKSQSSYSQESKKN